MVRLIRRWRYVYGWRLRHWWLDTPQGKHAQLTLGVLVLLAMAVGFARAGIAVATDSAQPKQAFIVALVILVVALVVGLALAMSASKAAKPPDQEVKAPTTQDGRSAVRYYGTNWIEDPAQLAWRVVGRDGIKAKGGK